MTTTNLPVDFGGKLTELSKIVYEANKDKGFHDKGRSFAETCMLIVSEISEAVEADRKDLAAFEGDAKVMMAEYQQGFFDSEHFKQTIKDTVEDELADALIRILDEAGRRGMDIEAHVMLKLAYNKTRPRLHGKKF